jgi:hypothetical protein
VVVTARDRARYHADLRAVEAVQAAAKRVHCDSSLAEAVKRYMQQDEEAIQRWLRCKKCITRMRSGDGVGPSGGQ